MIEKLSRLKNFLSLMDKSAAISVGIMMKKATSPYDAPELWELNPRDQEGEWVFEEDDLPTEEVTSPDKTMQGVTEEELEGIKRYLREVALRDNQDSPPVYEIQKIRRITSHEQSDFLDEKDQDFLDERRFWVVDTKYKITDPMEPPVRNENVEWHIWEIKPGEYGYEASVELPESKIRIYGEA